MTCTAGFIATFKDARNIWDSCNLPSVQCVCAELPGLQSNDLGRFSFVPIVLIVIPIVLPIVTAAKIDLIWFCTLVAVTLQTAWLSPPVALSAYFLKGVVPQWELKDIYAGMVQFMILQLVAVGLLLIFPKLATWLPTLN